MAIDDLLDEHEQGERVRQWLRENGAGLVGGVLIGLAAIGGWQWWQKHQAQQRVEIAGHYDAVGDRIDASKLDEAQAQVAKLPQGVYAALAALDLAKAQLEAGKRDAAIATLRNAKIEDPALAAVANTRLAQLLVDAGKARDALALLPADSTNAGIQQVRGDALFALGDAAQARDAYQKALTHMDVAAPQRRLVELKLSQAGGMPAKPEARS
ncbi:MAG TPA: tetratricopeptide repeat protein [Xanthomonadaceae bacterium]|jgi:predicted negative regulator of RcsB-dependent stress response|nr:tetratricopeptide repeat protein [Xanthomonadaceae bacterium]